MKITVNARDILRICQGLPEHGIEWIEIWSFL
jgi:hypothetical protein